MKDYIGWVDGKGYAVIDVNIPKFLTPSNSVSVVYITLLILY